eukprot:3445338-Ditylum_brightwellii.AAC.1
MGKATPAEIVGKTPLKRRGVTGTTGDMADVATTKEEATAEPDKEEEVVVVDQLQQLNDMLPGAN